MKPPTKLSISTNMHKKVISPRNTSKIDGLVSLREIYNISNSYNKYKTHQGGNTFIPSSQLFTPTELTKSSKNHPKLKTSKFGQFGSTTINL